MKSMILSDEELLKQAKSLREEAQYILDAKGLLGCFDEQMSPVIAGSVVTDLMTEPDIDITCCSDTRDFDRLFNLWKKIGLEFSVGRLTYINPKIVPWHDYSTGLYCGVKLRADSDRIWNVDIWMYTPKDFETVIKNHQSLAEKLQAIDRLMLLQLKSSCCQQSYEIYKAVLEYGVRSVDELTSYIEGKDGLTNQCT